MTEIQQGLLIAGIGMGLVFFLIILLWLLMVLMMRVTSNKKHLPAEGEDGDAVEPSSVSDIKEVESQRRAAAAGVAVALAISSGQKRIAGHMLKEERVEISPWLSYHRSRQLGNKK